MIGGAALPAAAVDHVGMATLSPHGFPLADALGAAIVEGRRMRSGVIVARFGPAEVLELIWPGGSNTPIDGFLERRGPGLHHLAIRVDDPLADVVATLRGRRIETAGAIERASDGRPSVFLHPTTMGGVLVELVEGPRP